MNSLRNRVSSAEYLSSNFEREGKHNEVAASRRKITLEDANRLRADGAANPSRLEKRRADIINRHRSGIEALENQISESNVELEGETQPGDDAPLSKFHQDNFDVIMSYEDGELDLDLDDIAGSWEGLAKAQACRK